MNHRDSTLPANRLQRKKLLQIEEICDAFESDLREGENAESLDVQVYLKAVDEELHESLREELLRIRTEWIEASPASRAHTSSDQPVTQTVRALNTAGHGPDGIPDCELGPWLFQRFHGRFEPLERLGAGASGVVWKVYDTRLNRVVAIKIPRAESKVNLTRFVREARAASRLDHPGIVRILELGDDDNGCFLLMEFIAGGSLAQRMADTPLSPEEATALSIQIADTLAYTHSHGIVHRDLKPQNILIDESGHPRLVDFGLAKDWLDDEAAQTMTGTMLGTPAYVAPEQAGSANGKSHPTADIYSAGIVLYEMLTGELPFRGSIERVLYQVHYVEPARPGLIQENIPDELETICLKCLEKDPTDRFQTAGELEAELVRFQEGKPIHSRRASVWKRISRWRKQHPGIAALVALSAMLLATTATVSTIAAIVLNNSRESERELRLVAEDAEGRAREALSSERTALRKESEALAEATRSSQLADKQALVAMEEARVSHEAIQFLQSTFQNTDPVNAFFGGSSQASAEPPTLESLLDNAVERIKSELSQQPTTQARLLDVLANSYRAMGKFEAAESLLKKSMTIRQQLEHDGEFASLNRSRDEAAHALYCGWLAHDRSQWEVAEKAYEDSLSKMPEPATRDHELLRAEILFQRGKLFIDRGQANHAIDSMRESLELRRRWLAEDHNLTKAAKIGLTFADNRNVADIPLGDVLAIVGSNHWASEIAKNYTSTLLHRRNRDFEKAIDCYEKVVERLETFLPNTHPLLILARGDFAGLLHEAGDYRRAFPLAMNVLKQGEQICPNHVKLQDFRLKLALELSYASQFEEAAELLYAVAKQEDISTNHFVKAHYGLIWCCIVNEKFAEGLEHAEKVRGLSSELTDRENAWYDYSYARMLSAADRDEEAAEMDRLAYERAIEVSVPPGSAFWLGRLSIIHAHHGDLPRAETMLREAVAIEREARPATHPVLAARLSGLAFMLKKQGKHQEAAGLFQEALLIWQAKLPENDSRIAAARLQLNQISSALEDPVFEKGNAPVSESTE